MNVKYKELIKNIITFAFGNLGSKLILFLLLPLYTNFLTKEQYGTVEIFNSILQLVVPFASLVIFDATLKFGISKYESKENVILISLFVILLGSVVLLFFIPILNFYEAIKEWNILFYFYVVAFMLNAVLINYVKVKEKNLLFSIINIVQTLTLALLNILLIVFFKLGVNGYLIANILCLLVASICSVLLSGLIKDLRVAKFDFNLLKKMIKYSLPLIINNISWCVIHSSDKIMIEYFIDLNSVGLYSVASKFPALINIFISIFSSAWSISTFKEFENEKSTVFFSNIFKIYWIIIFFATVVLNSIIYFIMKNYIGVEFLESWVYVPVLLFSASFFALSSYFASMFSAFGKNIHNMISILFAAILNIILNIILIQKISIWGAVVSTFIASAVLLIYRMIVLRKFIKIDYSIFKFCISIALVILSIIFALQRIKIALVILIVSYILLNVWELKNIIFGGIYEKD